MSPQIDFSQQDHLELYLSLPLQNILSSIDYSSAKANAVTTTTTATKFPKIFLLNMLLMEEFKAEIDLELRATLAAIQKIDNHLLLEARSDNFSIILPKLVTFLK